MSRGVNWYARTVLGLTPRDCSGAFRCYRTSLLAEVDFDAIRSRGYSFQEEILWHLKRLGAVFREVPITFADREKGNSKIGMREGLSALRVIAGLAIAKPPKSTGAGRSADREAVANGQGNERR